ncbi:hypothetical protein CEUSTIGMA_g4571.t1 [Chlamydomonas eustigma]|uniref:Uncharacterized protein n=1 Tax=Chlamydomonas eustigma TaxID=1157962 RepID=A0A250X246_9CHLO|nr:hypothetical protein CEUSTIGMA_g4571.t1 [Chlamydomonas eustigma]|eukprot:GAX77125.1 hypothetical protein CEUSTIGMA_g4571.t1 [Chlamydomonas eustigma]
MDSAVSSPETLLDFSREREEAMKLAERPPPLFLKELDKFYNTVISSGTIALIRVLISPPSHATSAGVEEAAVQRLPAWFSAQYKTQTSFQTFLRQYGKDTLILTGCAYLMDGVDQAVKWVRGVDDVSNRMIGGVAAGGALGVAWYSGSPTGRAMMSAGGALVGYLSFVFEQILLEQQQKLERELLKKPEVDILKEMQPHYLRALIRVKQRQLDRDHQSKQKQLMEEQILSDKTSASIESRLTSSSQTSTGRPAGFVRRPDELEADRRRGWDTLQASNEQQVGVFPTKPIKPMHSTGRDGLTQANETSNDHVLHIEGSQELTWSTDGSNENTINGFEERASDLGLKNNTSADAGRDRAGNIFWRGSRVQKSDHMKDQDKWLVISDDERSN